MYYTNDVVFHSWVVHSDALQMMQFSTMMQYTKMQFSIVMWSTVMQYTNDAMSTMMQYTNDAHEGQYISTNAWPKLHKNRQQKFKELLT